MTAVRIGLIADTHMPARCRALPPAVFDALRGVDLLLHAGDVGELWVLDRLSAIAPVIAVHGNDHGPDEARELPYQQIIGVHGQRILLTHSHYPDRAEEMEARKSDDWAPKLARRIAMGRRAGARIVVFGHIHIPLTYEEDGILLINPGAIAAPNAEMRQRVRSVAILTIDDDGAPSVAHIDLAQPELPFVPRIDWEAGFRAAHKQFGLSILAPDLAADFSRFFHLVRQVAPETGLAAHLHLAHQCWAGERSVITRADLIRAVDADAAIPTDAKAQILALLRHEA